MSCRLIIASAVLAALGGCAVNPVSQSIDPGMGEAVKYNAAIQTIDPDPVYAADGAQPGDNGEVGATAVKRYRTDQVKAVQTQTTTAGSGGGGGAPQ